MKCADIMELLEQEYPKSCAMDWDNPGLLVGESSTEVTTILVALDATDEVIEEAAEQKAQLLVTHHPMLFQPLKQINDSSINGRRVLKLIQNGIACYAMHTNFDIRGMAQINGEQLGLINAGALSVTGEKDGTPEGIGQVGDLLEEMEYSALAAFVKEAFRIPDVRCYGKQEGKISRVAVCGGSGQSTIADAKAAGAQVLVTGDISYHVGIDAAAEGLRIIDAGHYGTEYVFMDYMTEKLQRLCPSCRVVRSHQRPPFVTV